MEVGDPPVDSRIKEELHWKERFFLLVLFSTVRVWNPEAICIPGMKGWEIAEKWK